MNAHLLVRKFSQSDFFIMTAEAVKEKVPEELLKTSYADEMSLTMELEYVALEYTRQKLQCTLYSH